MIERVTAGGVVVQYNNILLIKHRDDGKLGFPKGWIDEGESIEEAAIRETEEESGLRELRVMKKLGEVHRKRFEEYKDLEVMKVIHLFLMTAGSYEQGEAEEDNGWFTYEEGVENMKYPEEAEFLQNYRNEIFG